MDGWTKMDLTSHFADKCNVKTGQTGIAMPRLNVCPSLLSHLPSSVTEVWYPCGRVSCKSTVGRSTFSLASMPDVPPPSGTAFLKMWRGAGRGACGGGGARAFILLLGDDNGKDTGRLMVNVICCCSF